MSVRSKLASTPKAQPTVIERLVKAGLLAEAQKAADEKNRRLAATRKTLFDVLDVIRAGVQDGSVTYIVGAFGAENPDERSRHTMAMGAISGTEALGILAAVVNDLIQDAQRKADAPPA